MSHSPSRAARDLAAALARGPRETSSPTRERGVERAVEVGVGRRPAVALALAERGVDVTATDVVDRDVPDPVRFVRDDVTDPDPAVYADADLVYALNCPPELQRPARDVAREVGATFRFTTLGGDPALVAATSRYVADETLFTASAQDRDRRE